MSYNITKWETKRLENLVIPINALYADTIREDWLPEQPTISANGQEVIIRGGCEQEIKGLFVDTERTAIRITGFQMRGEGSGTFWHEVLRQALKKSTGTLEAVRVWEGGDYIDRLSVKDGVVTETGVKL